MEARPPWGSGSGPGVIGDALTRLTLEQRAGQLFMAGLQSGATPTEAGETNATIRTQHAGNVVLYSTGWKVPAGTAAPRSARPRCPCRRWRERRTSDIAPMTQVVLAEVAADPAFAAQIEGSVERVLRVKAALGLLPTPSESPGRT